MFHFVNASKNILLFLVHAMTFISKGLFKTVLERTMYTAWLKYCAISLQDIVLRFGSNSKRFIGMFGKIMIATLNSHLRIETTPAVETVNFFTLFHMFHSHFVHKFYSHFELQHVSSLFFGFCFYILFNCLLAVGFDQILPNEHTLETFPIGSTLINHFSILFMLKVHVYLGKS